MVLPLTHPVQNFVFCLDGLSSSKLTARNALLSVDDSKFSGGQATVKMGADLVMSDLAHTSAQSVPDQGTFIDNGLALEVLIAGERERFSHSLKRIDWFRLKPRSFPCCTNHGLGLVSKVCRQLTMRGDHFSRRMNFFTVAGRVCGDLGGLFP
jgi:hypothetical protein